MEILPGTHLVSFPLLPEEATVTTLLADHFPAGASYEEATRIVTLGAEGYESAWYNSAGNYWAGSLHWLEPQKGYWLVVPEGSDPVTLTLVGTSLGADTVSVGTIEEGLNLVAAPVPFAITLAASGLIESGFEPGSMAMNTDRLSSYDPQGFLTAWANNGSNWNGNHFLLEPERGYIVWRAPGGGDFDWELIRSAIGNDPVIDGEGVEWVEQIRFEVPTLTTPPQYEQGNDDPRQGRRERGSR
ncbi:hypothetical protein KQI63_09880 [bacterium]|nr:hypothetical protein [bacterium]